MNLEDDISASMYIIKSFKNHSHNKHTGEICIYGHTWNRILRYFIIHQNWLIHCCFVIPYVPLIISSLYLKNNSLYLDHLSIFLLYIASTWQFFFNTPTSTNSLIKWWRSDRLLVVWLNSRLLAKTIAPVFPISRIVVHITTISKNSRTYLT